MFPADYPELPWAAALAVTATVIAAWAWRVRGHAFDPRLFFPPLYAYVSISPCLYSLFFDRPYHRGIVVSELPNVYASGCTALIGFAIGCSLGMRHLARARFDGRSPAAAMPRLHRESATVMRQLSIAGAALALLGYTYFMIQVFQSQPEGGGVSKSVFFQYVTKDTLRGLHFCTSACSVFLVTYIISDSTTGGRLISVPTVGLLGLYSLLCTLGGEREFVITLLVWIAANWTRMGRSGRLAMAAAALIPMIAIPVIRKQGLGAGNMTQGVEQFDMAEAVRSFMHLSPNLLVFSVTAATVPDQEPHWYGKSVVNAFRSFLPGQPESIHYTPARWFADIYEFQGRAGYAYSQDAEAYLNFGYAGIPVWYAIWGALIGFCYRKAHELSATPAAIFIWWQSLMAFSFAIRSDSRAPIKIIVLGAVAVKLMMLISGSLSGYIRQSGRSATPTPPHHQLPPPQQVHHPHLPPPHDPTDPRQLQTGHPPGPRS